MHDGGADKYASLGPREYLDRFLDEYGLTRRQAGDRIKRDGDDFLVHHSLLRAHGEYGCAGDREALAFCREIADTMVNLFGIPLEEAEGRIEDAWARPGEQPVWIVGLDLVYHETADYWAQDIYYGHDSFWWSPGANPKPRPYESRG